MDSEERPHEEIIIVRRGHDDHDDHHGGAWKVAFADFMTAMMAFFLVMWLINASSEETKKAVASYFNPIKLTDKTSNPKGLRAPKYGDVSDEEIKDEEKSTVITKSKVVTLKGEGVAQTFDEQALFSDPYALLAEISTGMNTSVDSKNSEDKAKSRSRNMGLSGGEAFKDPFDPSSWNMDYDIKDGENELAKLEEQLDEQIDPIESKEMAKIETQEDSKNPEMKNPDKSDMEISKLEKSKRAKLEESKNSDLEELESNNNVESKKQNDKKQEEAESELLQNMRKELQEIVSQEGKNAPDVQIKGDKSGTVITLFDKSKSGMFSIGSARPSPEMVRIMKKIGELLSREKGKIIVGGHTDGRKFKSKTYDNWRLSTARAHMAYYMLVRGGVPEARFEMISGFGAVKLAVPDDPYSPVNRRIEISLRVS